MRSELKSSNVGYVEECRVMSVSATSLIERNILTNPNFPEHVCLTTCVGLPPPGPK